ncbi:hypothetical protein ACFVDU_30455 [Streptomyces albidoflavus]
MPDRTESDATPRPEQGPAEGDLPGRWWRERWWRGPALSGAAPVLLLCAAATPLAHRFGERFGSVPWWVVVWPLAAIVVLLAGAGARRSLNRAAWLALPGLPLGLLAYLNGAEELPPPGPFLPAPEPARPAAALLAAALCLAAAALCRLLGRAGEPSAAPGRPVRLLSHATVWGAVAGIALTSVTGYGALTLEEWRRGEPSLVDAVSRTVPEGKRGEGVRMTGLAYSDPAPHGGFTKVLWDKELPGPAALTTCLLDDKPPTEGDEPERGREAPVIARSTLVSVESGKGWDAVVGYDPADGTERWRYTVRYEKLDRPFLRRDHPGNLGQVGVSASCAVHVVAGPDALVTLDGNSGEVRHETVLPRGEEGARDWVFVTGEHPPDGTHAVWGKEWRGVVPLGSSRQFFLQGSPLVEVAQHTGRVVSTTGHGCVPMAAASDPRGNRDPFAVRDVSLLMQDCSGGNRPPHHTEVGEPPSRTEGYRADAEPYDVPQRPPASEYHHISALGCASPPLLTDFQAGSRGAAVAGVWCRNEGGDEDEDERKLLVSEAGFGTQVAELPPDTPLPLRPVVVDSLAPTDFHVVWLADGELRGLRHGGEPGKKDREVMYREGALQYSAVRPDTVYAGPEPLEAFQVHTQNRVGKAQSTPLLLYAVTRSGTVLAMEHQRRGVGNEATLVPELAPYGELPEVAGRCEGTRDMSVDRVRLKLLTWCTTDQGSKVTAVGLDPIGRPWDR